jgi:hypothetical protein
MSNVQILRGRNTEFINDSFIYLLLIVVLPCILISLKLSFQQMHYLLKYKMLQYLFKCFFTQLLHFSVRLDHQGAHIRTLLKL